MRPLGFDRIIALTFDCYGTLIDWENGAIAALRPFLIEHGVTLSDDEIIEAFQDLEEKLSAPPYKPYKDVLAGVVQGFGRRFGFSVSLSQSDVLTRSVPLWKPFPDTVDALRALKGRFKLAVISNIDADLFAASAKSLGVAFDHVVTAEQARCYKPDLPIFEEAIRRLAVAPYAIVHVAEGPSEISPARQLGCTTVWVRWFGRSARLLTDLPDLQVPDLKTLVSLIDRDDKDGGS